MARYREKDETDLAWNAVRRQITRDLDTSIANAREEVLNKLLGGAWDKFVAAIGDGKTLELEGTYDDLVDKIVADIVPRHLSIEGSGQPAS